MKDIKLKILNRIEEYKNLGYKVNAPIIGWLRNGGISISKGDEVHKLTNEIINSDKSINKNWLYFRNYGENDKLFLNEVKNKNNIKNIREFEDFLVDTLFWNRSSFEDDWYVNSYKSIVEKLFSVEDNYFDDEYVVKEDKFLREIRSTNQLSRDSSEISRFRRIFENKSGIKKCPIYKNILFHDYIDIKCDKLSELIYEVHHIVPVRLGGSEQHSNLICLCCNCHNVVLKNEEKWIEVLRKLKR